MSKTMQTILVGVLIAGSVPVLEALTRLDPAEITDWRSWAVGLGAGFVRQAAVFAIAQVVAYRAASRREP